MGLISKEDRVKGLFNASSAESLHIPSEPASEDELPPPPPPVVHHQHQQHPAGPKPRVRPIPTAFFHLRKVLGKKKSRRYQDVSTLMTLVEEDEFGEVSISDLVPHNDSQFAHLLRDSSSMAVWNEFIESSEEAQQCLLRQFGDAEKVQRKRDNNGEVLSGEAAFQTMDHNLRSFLQKGKVPLRFLCYMEERVTSFFLENPLETFVSDSMSSYERLMLHAISQYHQLLSHSVDAKDATQGRFVKVVNPHQDFGAPALSLGEYLRAAEWKRQHGEGASSKVLVAGHSCGMAFRVASRTKDIKDTDLCFSCHDVFFMSAGCLLLLFLLVCFIMIYQRSSIPPMPVFHSIIIANDGLNGPSISQEDDRLIAKMRSVYLQPPPPANVPLNLTDPQEFDTSMGQAQAIKKLLKYKRNGFFIECGALDGEIRSNTLYFERYLGWTGLLIEGDPSNFAAMVHKHRKAWLSPACLSLNPYPSIVSFKQNFNMGQVSQYPAGHAQSGYVDVQCFPLYSFLLALDRKTVDYFSLDVEGAELAVLQTIPWSKVDIKVLSVEFIHGPEGKEALQNYMETIGYELVETVVHANNLANDFIFVKK